MTTKYLNKFAGTSETVCPACGHTSFRDIDSCSEYEDDPPCTDTYLYCFTCGRKVWFCNYGDPTIPEPEFPENDNRYGEDVWQGRKYYYSYDHGTGMTCIVQKGGFEGPWPRLHYRGWGQSNGVWPDIVATPDGPFKNATRDEIEKTLKEGGWSTELSFVTRINKDSGQLEIVYGDPYVVQSYVRACKEECTSVRDNITQLLGKIEEILQDPSLWNKIHLSDSAEALRNSFGNVIAIRCSLFKEGWETIRFGHYIPTGACITSYKPELSSSRDVSGSNPLLDAVKEAGFSPEQTTIDLLNYWTGTVRLVGRPDEIDINYRKAIEISLNNRYWFDRIIQKTLSNLGFDGKDYYIYQPNFFQNFLGNLWAGKYCTPEMLQPADDAEDIAMDEGFFYALHAKMKTIGLERAGLFVSKGKDSKDVILLHPLNDIPESAIIPKAYEWEDYFPF